MKNKVIRCDLRQIHDIHIIETVPYIFVHSRLLIASAMATGSKRVIITMVHPVYSGAVKPHNIPAI